MAILQKLKALVMDNHWLSEEEMNEGLALVQLYPGPIMVDFTAYVGYKLRGVPGAILATLGFILPSYGLMLILSAFYFAAGNLPWVHPLFLGLEALVIGILFNVTLDLGARNIQNRVQAVIALFAFAALLFKANAILIVLVALALVTAAGLWTKTSAYLALPLALLAILWRARDGAPLGSRLALGLGPALLLGLPWWARNWAVYGAGDLLGLRRHDAVVVGQPRTVEWLAQMGPLPFLRQALETTFHSFWGQFGWMGVLLDSRIYLALQMLTLLVALGLGWALWEMMRSGELTSFQRRALAFLGAWLALTAASYLWYNLTFVQHQGRYLFPALPVWGLAFALGWSQALQPRCSRWGSVFFLALTALYVGEGLWSGDVNKWAAAMAGALAIALGINSWLLPAWLRRWIAPLVYVGLAALDLLALWGFILPQLS